MKNEIVRRTKTEPNHRLIWLKKRKTIPSKTQKKVRLLSEAEKKHKRQYMREYRKRLEVKEKLLKKKPEQSQPTINHTRQYPITKKVVKLPVMKLKLTPRKDRNYSFNKKKFGGSNKERSENSTERRKSPFPNHRHKTNKKRILKKKYDEENNEIGKGDFLLGSVLILLWLLIQKIFRK